MVRCQHDPLQPSSRGGVGLVTAVSPLPEFAWPALQPLPAESTSSCRQQQQGGRGGGADRYSVDRVHGEEYSAVHEGVVNPPKFTAEGQFCVAAIFGSQGDRFSRERFFA